MKKLLAIALGMFAVSAMADITLDGPTFITSSTTVSEKVTGSGYYVVQNGATLTLSNVENDFTGGVICSNGVVEATASGAFGTGDIVLWRETTAQIAQVVFNAVGGTFPNAIRYLYNNGWANSSPGILAKKNATVTGQVTFECENQSSSYMGIAAGVRNDASTTVVLTFTEAVNADTGRIIAYGYQRDNLSTVVFKKKVTAKVLYAGYSAAEVGKVELWDPDNAIGELQVKLLQARLMAKDVLKGTHVRFDTKGFSIGAERALIYMNGNDQHIADMEGENPDVNADVTVWSSGRTLGFISDRHAVLTISKVSANYRAETGLIGPIDLVVDDENGGTKGQYMTRRWNTNAGSISVAKGYLRMERGIKFLNVTNLVVESGARIETDSITNSLPAVKTIALNGKIVVDAKSPTPFACDAAKMFLGPNAELYLGKGVTNTVKALYIDGVRMPQGIYTKDNLPLMKHPTSEASYTGALEVLKGGGMVMLFR